MLSHMARSFIRRAGSPPSPSHFIHIHSFSFLEISVFVFLPVYLPVTGGTSGEREDGGGVLGLTGSPEEKMQPVMFMF